MKAISNEETLLIHLSKKTKKMLFSSNRQAFITDGETFPDIYRKGYNDRQCPKLFKYGAPKTTNFSFAPDGKSVVVRCLNIKPN